MWFIHSEKLTKNGYCKTHMNKIATKHPKNITLIFSYIIPQRLEDNIESKKQYRKRQKKIPCRRILRMGAWFFLLDHDNLWELQIFGCYEEKRPRKIVELVPILFENHYNYHTMKDEFMAIEQEKKIRI